MTMLAVKGTENGALTLADYEARIYLYKEQIGTGYIGIGRTLTEAKEAKVVPHGEWEAWVTRTTGLTPRQAQRCMQAAAEIRDGSALARLEMSKALMLLQSGLEEEQQEEIAERADREGATVRELRAEISRLKEEKDNGETARQLREMKLKLVQETGAAAEIREELKKADAERSRLEGQIRDLHEGMRRRLDEASGQAYRRGQQDGRTAAEHEIGRDARELEEQLKEANRRALNAEMTAGRRVEQARQDADRLYAEGMQEKEKELERLSELLDRQGKHVDELRDELAAAEAREEKRAAQMEALRKEKQARDMADARGGIAANAPGALDLAAAVREFIGKAGALPQMSSLLAGMEDAEREAVRIQVETIGRWVDGAREALGIVAAHGTVV